MKIIIIGSGSRGNCTYIETATTKIIIDAGISLLQVKTKLKEHNIDLKEVDALFVTHEHSDHVAYLGKLLVHTRAHLYVDKLSFNVIDERNKNFLSTLPHTFIEKDTRYDVGDLSIVPIELSHDTVNCVGYLVKQLNVDTNESFAVVTDTGYLNSKYFKVLSNIKIILFESNHDIEMLRNSNRSWFLIERILSIRGHLSNDECSQYLKKFISNNNKCIILGHLSEECNTEELAYNKVIETFGNELPFKLYIAKQREALEINTEDYD